jgi:hypothetical protein
MVTYIFEAATSMIVGDGATTFFWLDKWLLEGRLKDLAPHLFVRILRRLSRSRMVKDSLSKGWVEDIPADLDALAIDELLAVADRMERLTVSEGAIDVFCWKWGSKETYSAKSRYLGMLNGSMAMVGALQVWKSHALVKCGFFLWFSCVIDVERWIG